MKKILSLLLTLVCTLTLATPVMAVDISTPMESIPVYRLYLDKNKEHLYTTSPNEAKVLSTEHGWKYEGVAWFAPNEGDGIYRLYNPVLQNHHYTSDLNEIKVLTTKDVWKLDNNGKPLFYSGGTGKIYRLYYSGHNGVHHLTTDKKEYNTLKEYGWKQEGVACKCVAKGDPKYPITFPQKEVGGDQTIENTASMYTIEADVSLKGKGTGYHAKLVACTPTAAVSFGLQYDAHAVSPYTGHTALLIENVYSNDPGMQKYKRVGYGARNKEFHLMLAVKKNGQCNVYVDGEKVGSVKNKGLAEGIKEGTLALRVEGSARLNGDSVNATFSNIRLKRKGFYNESKEWGTYDFTTNKGIKSNAKKYEAEKKITIKGTIKGLTEEEDWDSAYDKVSGIIQFVA